MFTSLEQLTPLELANVLPVAARLMINDNPNAVLVTEADAWHGFRGPEFIVTYVEKALCCPISMIPTVYGMRLMDHLQLGCSVPAKFHDSKLANAFILKWQKALPYSTNIKLSSSEYLMRAMLSLASISFVDSFITNDEESPSKPKLSKKIDPPPKLPNDQTFNITPEEFFPPLIGPALPYTPLTYYHILR